MLQSFALPSSLLVPGSLCPSVGAAPVEQVSDVVENGDLGEVASEPDGDENDLKLTRTRNSNTPAHPHSDVVQLPRAVLEPPTPSKNSEHHRHMGLIAGTAALVASTPTPADGPKLERNLGATKLPRIKMTWRRRARRQIGCRGDGGWKDARGSHASEESLRIGFTCFTGKGSVGGQQHWLDKGIADVDQEGWW
ncbi:hypothetical protein GALMADRAFT_213407 [Galerina marginata CBS 339.88]|uniref:Uncharacterized protein n=1 Tax=Galerina marginata (strain CBS 339.88) TaxID=685588 RepID=A0A067SNH2_GALM3|nr:hypothetical protein GALMADRAFT_213407 [Galerina marginata CBS 339.88]